MFIVQPTTSFGGQICEELNATVAGRRQWQSFEFAAAWLNHPGATTIQASARRFLADGGRIRATVGLDFSSTSYEGLAALLDLEDKRADIETYVFFDENRGCTFHPKVFLFSNAERARLLVGSNNMTGGGLSTNVEATLGITGTLGDETIQAARTALAAWRDERLEPRRARRLTSDFLKQLSERGYVRTEEEIRHARSKSSVATVSSGEPLFGRSPASPGNSVGGTRGPGSGGGKTTTSATGEVLLMRVRPRRKDEEGRGKQVQISLVVYRSAFWKEARVVVSDADGSRKTFGFNDNSGKPNTARFEAPEMLTMTNPVARFRWVDTAGSAGELVRELHYEIFDAESPDGAPIFARLKEGIATHPVTKRRVLSQDATVLSTSTLEIAQWYRLDPV